MRRLDAAASGQDQSQVLARLLLFDREVDAGSGRKKCKYLFGKEYHYTDIPVGASLVPLH